MAFFLYLQTGTNALGLPILSHLIDGQVVWTFLTQSSTTLFALLTIGLILFEYPL